MFGTVNATTKADKRPFVPMNSVEMPPSTGATANKSKHLMLVKEKLCHFKGGETVKVIDGPFKGVEGKVARVAGQQRVVISLANIGLISTAYVPTAFLKIIE